MGVELGIGMSHAPFLFLPTSQWPTVHDRLVKDVPQPLEFSRETPDDLDAYAGRVAAAFDRLAQEVAAFRPDAVVIIGDDQREVFDAALSPTLAVYVGEEVSGTTNIAIADQDISQNHLKMRCASELAAGLVRGLVRRGFDPTLIREIRAQGRPEGGLGHAFTRACKALRLAELDVPIVPIFIEAYHPPMPTASRCIQLGRAIRDALADRPERVAIVGSGGLSHDPGGPRAGWIDEPLDRWILTQFEHGDLEAVASLFEFESRTLSGGTGEVRSWIVAAAAMEGAPATVLDYLPIYHALTGAGFAYWRPTAR